MKRSLIIYSLQTYVLLDALVYDLAIHLIRMNGIRDFPTRLMVVEHFDVSNFEFPFFSHIL
jgi:hypothetical protein